MSDAFPNSIREGVPWSADLEPDGPDVQYGYGRRVNQGSPVTDEDVPYVTLESQNDSGDLYAGLPDIAVPKHKVT